VNQAVAARYRWERQLARENQLPPAGDWQTWMVLAGRGFGKTRMGAEWVAHQAWKHDKTRWAVVAPTFSDARDVCVEGESGLKAILERYGVMAKWNRSLGEIDLTNGSKIKMFSADEPERLRGPQHHGAWCDELAAWRYEAAWDQLRFGLRLGELPRTIVTTTPKPIPLVRRLMDLDSTTITRGSTFDNAGNLSTIALEEFQARYEGTRLGRQELFGEILEDVPGALWTRKMLDDYRVTEPPRLKRVVVGVDPAVTNTEDSDSTGIIVAGVGDDGDFYVFADRTLKASPDGWAREAVIAFHSYSADSVIVESNQGGDLNEAVLRTIEPDLPIRMVNARRGKQIRAEPIAALSEQGKFHIVGSLESLEDELTSWTPDAKKSPDRLDAMVHAVTALMQQRVVAPAVAFRT
jgi:phage terminase large subunit-like protein